MKIWTAAILLVFSTTAFSQEKKPANPSWDAIQKSKTGTITVYWFDNNPFSHKDSKGVLTGIEFEIMEGFRRYVRDTFKINLDVRWTEVRSFDEVFDKIKSNSQIGIFGCAGFSITEGRRKIVKLSPPYMADLAVLVSTDDIPILKTGEDFRKYFSGATAITIPGTLMEKDLNDLSESENVPFQMEFVSNSLGFLSAIKNRKKAFGYLSLPVYLMNLTSRVAKVNRQNYFTEIKEGHGIGLPKNSDWDVPINAYFSSRAFKTNVEGIVSHYISLDFYHFLKTLTAENEVTLLNKEKEIQRREIHLQESQINEKSRSQNVLLLVIIIVSILLFTILILFRNQLRNHRLLKKQNAEIETQADEIRSINENLEAIVKQRTHDLERKNQALEEYAFITAHKLRAPLATILGLVSLFDRLNLTEEHKTTLTHLEQSAQNLDTVIQTVMNSIEGANTSSFVEGTSPNKISNNQYE